MQSPRRGPDPRGRCPRGSGLREALRVLGCALLVLMVSGCRSNLVVTPSSIAQAPHASGDGQCGFYRAELPEPLRVAVYGDTLPGVLGGSGRKPPASGVPVVFRVNDPRTGAVFSESGNSEFTTTTNTEGVASASLTLGDRPGEVTVTASASTSSGTKSVSFRALAGIKLIGSGLEAPTGGVIDGFGLQLQDPSGQPLQGVPVYFRVEGDGYGAAVDGKRSTRVLTDSEGLALASWTLGSETAQYFTRVEVRDTRENIDETQRFHLRALDFTAMALDRKKMLMELAGGLAIFIYGMRLMSGGLRRMADRRLKSILQAMTRNRFMATGVGTILTAIIQSSSATTVMAVGFVNAGLLTLSQAIAVDYGACIGTTITAQIIAFRLNVLAFPAIALGLVLSATSRRASMKSFGEAVLGFGLLFLGLTLMSDILEPLRHSPTFRAWFQLFDCTPVDGGLIRPIPAMMCIFIGTVATMIVQSSSATIGLVLVLASQGLLSFYTAFPLVLGDNIGTTITAVLASLGANRNAKRAAIAHTLFKVFGAAYMYVLLFVPLWNGQPVFLGFVDYITPGEVFVDPPENLARHIANAHTAFNVINVLLFLPCIALMVRLCRWIIPMTDVDQEKVLAYLEPNLLNSPPLALQQAVKEVAYMVRRAQKSINDGCTCILDGDRELEKKILAREEVIDRLQAEITAYLVELSRKNLTPSEATLLPALVHAVNDAERIGDHSEDLVELANLRREGKHTFSDDAEGDIRRLLELLNEQFDATHNSLTTADQTQVGVVLDRENDITRHMQAAAESHVRRLNAERCDLQAGVIFLDVLNHLERVGDHLVNIAERAGRIIRVMNAGGPLPHSQESAPPGAGSPASIS